MKWAPCVVANPRDRTPLSLRFAPSLTPIASLFFFNELTGQDTSLADSQTAIKWAKHIVLFFPLWLGDMPALLKGFLEQVARPGFAFSRKGKNPLANKGLTGRSARVVVTMGMPALVYRWYFRAHSIKSIERNILGFVGISPVDETLIGMAGNMEPETAQKWLTKLEKLGTQGT